MTAEPLRIILLALLLAGASVPAATLYVDASSTNSVPPYTNWLTAAAVIQDAVDASAPGDEVVVTNGVYASGGRAIYGTMTNRVAVDRAITLRSVNGPEVTIIQGYQVSGTITGNGAIRCVYLTNGAILSGFMLTNGASRRTGQPFREQVGGGLQCESTTALATNCVLAGNSAYFQGGGASSVTLHNCILMGNTAQFAGGGAANCLLNDCTLSGNTVRAGANSYGGGAFQCTLNKCRLGGNSASYEGGGAYDSELNNCTLEENSADFGGGAAQSYLFNCRIRGNDVRGVGGGAYLSILGNCTLTENSAASVGGADRSTLNNCILVGNTGEDGSNHFNCTLNYCCTIPLPTNGLGNITNEPRFVDMAGGNLRLQANSPCINTGNNAYAVGSTDMDGRPRIVGTSVDMGAYEVQDEFLAWLQQFSFPTNGTADFTDPDSDRFNNYQEYRCDTVPTNALSCLYLLPPVPAGADMTLTWPSGAGRNYFLEWSTNLSATPMFLPLATDLPGQPGTTTFTHTNGAGLGPCFYRLAVP